MIKRYFIFGVLAVAALSHVVPRAVASSYFSLMLINNQAGLPGNGASSLSPSPALPYDISTYFSSTGLSSSTLSLLASKNAKIRSAAYASTSEAIIANFKKGGITLKGVDFPKNPPKVTISSLSKSTAEPGALITIFGKGFDKNSLEVTFNDEKAAILATSLNTAVQVRIPSTVYGMVSVKVKANGETSLPYPLTVVKAGKEAPNITLKDKKADIGTELTLSGTGIAKENTIKTTVGEIRKVKAFSGKITFTFADVPGFSRYEGISTDDRAASTSVMIWIENENGISNLVGPLLLTLK